MTIKFHGTPITPRSIIETLRGYSFCVSFAQDQDIKWCLELGNSESTMLDNGGYSDWTQGRTPNWPEYYRWCEKWLRHRNSWAVIPDVIGGSEDENDKLIEEWPHGNRGSPVWHVHETIDRLKRLCMEWDTVCFGSSGEFRTVGSPNWHDRISEAFEAIVDKNGIPICKIHMLRGLKCLSYNYPFHSVDSANVARNHARQKKNRGESALDMVRRFEALSCPNRFHPKLPIIPRVYNSEGDRTIREMPLFARY